MTPVDVTDEFVECVRRRLRVGAVQKVDAPELESLEYSAGKVNEANPECETAVVAMALNKAETARSIAVKALSTGWGLSESGVSEVVETLTRSPELRVHLADYLFMTGRGERLVHSHPIFASPLAARV